MEYEPGPHRNFGRKLGSSIDGWMIKVHPLVAPLIIMLVGICLALIAQD